MTTQPIDRNTSAPLDIGPPFKLNLRGITRQALAASFAIFLIAAGSCRAGSAGIEDRANFFSEKAKMEAAQDIAEMRRSTKKDLAIETFLTLPDDVKQGINLQDKPAVDRAVEQWARKLASQKSINGVLVLIVKEPARLRAEVGNDTAKVAFTLKDRDALASSMRAQLHVKQNDTALLEGVRFVSSTMKSHALARTPLQHTGYGEARSSESSWSPILLVLLGIGAIWLVIRLFMSLAGGGRPGGVPPGQYPPNQGMGPMQGGGGGGGGFFRSMLGGVFGSVAGMWMYDRFFGQHGGSGFSNFGGGQDYGDSSRDSNNTGFSGQDTDYSGSGGSFGDDWNSNSDSGGGGGGDDSGGGGDF